MTTPNGLALTAAHDVAQARLLDAGLAELTTIFMTVLDPRDLTGSAPGYTKAAAASVKRTRAQASALARDYYNVLRSAETGAEGSLSPYAAIVGEAPVDEALETSMLVTGPVQTKSALSRGALLQDALGQALTMTLGSATRHVEGGPRDVARINAHRDPLSRGWSRRSGGVPCSFCAMLISRGPVYASEGSGSFRSHDHCHCKAVAFFGTDTGWTAQAAEYRDLWTAAKKDPDKAVTFESLYRQRYPKTKKPVDVRDEAYRSNAARKAAATRSAKRDASTKPPLTVVPEPVKPTTGVAILDEAKRLPIAAERVDVTDLKAASVAADKKVARLLKDREKAFAAGDYDAYDALRDPLAEARLAREQAEAALGKANAAFDQLAKDTNPLHGNFADYGINCTHVAAAYELRRRGFDVIATARSRTDPLRQRGLNRDLAHRWRTPEGTTRDFNLVLRPKTDLVREMEDGLPEGGRAWVVNSWTGGGAHIFNAEKVNGKVVFTEAQTLDRAGDLPTPDNYVRRFARGKAAWWLRVDDLVPTDEVTSMLWKADDVDGLRARSTPLRRGSGSLFG